MRDSDPSKLGHRRAVATEPLGGLRSSLGMTRHVARTLEFLNEPLDHMRCDVGRGRRGGRAYLYRLLGGDLGGLVGGRRSG